MLTSIADSTVEYREIWRENLKRDNASENGLIKNIIPTCIYLGLGLELVVELVLLKSSVLFVY